MSTPIKKIPLSHIEEIPTNEDNNVIEIREGEYLMDIINEINALPPAEKPTVDSPLTINFYNHSKTIDWSRFTAQIHWPQHVYLNFVGEINWWPVYYYPGMGPNEGLLSQNGMEKIFLGFSFNRENVDELIKISGLPDVLKMIYFGGLDNDLLEFTEWSEVDINNISNRGIFRVNGSKDDNVMNDALYINIGGNSVDVTPDFRYGNYIGKNLQYAFFYSANCQNADFTLANCQRAHFSSANCQRAIFYSANLQDANFYSANLQNTNFNLANCQGANFGSANLQGTNFGSANCQNAFFTSTNCEYTSFNSANLKNSNWYNVISIANANFQNADLTGAANFPSRINTKAKFIAECGAGKVNAQTIWIDGTSILT